MFKRNVDWSLSKNVLWEYSLMLMPATYFCRYIISDKENLASIQTKRFMLCTLALKFEIFGLS